jgi:hypothetical protein
MIKVAINGLGRIGRATLKIILETPRLDLVAVNDLIAPDNLAYLLRLRLGLWEIFQHSGSRKGHTGNRWRLLRVFFQKKIIPIFPGKPWGSIWYLSAPAYSEINPN